MKRIYSNYSEEEYNMIQKLAKESGFSLSCFQHNCVLNYAKSKGNMTVISSLLSEMIANMSKIHIGQTFIVSDLFSAEEWFKLTRNNKMTLAKQLAINVRNNSNFIVYKTKKGKTTIYKRIK